MDSTDICSDINDTPIQVIESPESDFLSGQAFSAIQAISKIQETEHGIGMDAIAMEYSPSSAAQSLNVKVLSDIQSLSGDSANTPFNSLKRQCAFDDTELGNRKKRLTLEEETFLSLDRSCNAMLNGDASHPVVDKNNLSTSSQIRVTCVDTFEDGDCGNHKDTLTEVREGGLSATITASGELKTDNSLADEFAEFMASAFVTTSCSKDQEKDPLSNIISDIVCNGSNEFECNNSNELLDNECNGSNELHEDECSGSDELLEKCTDLNVLRNGDCNSSNESHEEEYKGSKELPDDVCTRSNERPEVKEDNDLNELPEKCIGSPKITKDVPKDECSKSKELHERKFTHNGSNEFSQGEDNDSNQLTGSVEEFDDSNDLPEEECNGSNQSSEHEYDNSNELPGDDYDRSKKLKKKKDRKGEVHSKVSIHRAKIICDDSLSALSASAIGIISKTKDNEDKGNNDSLSASSVCEIGIKSEFADNEYKGNNDLQDGSVISDVMVIPELVASKLKPQNIEENRVDISDIPAVDGHSQMIDGTTKEDCEESKETKLSPAPSTSTQKSDSVDRDLRVDDVGAVNSCLSSSVSQCSEATETDGKNVRRSTRKISQSERASAMTKTVAKETPRKSGRPKGARNLNNRGDTPSNSPSIPSEATVASPNVRPMGKLLMELGLQCVSEQIYKDLINIQKVRMQTHDTETDHTLLERLVVTHKNLIDKNEAYKCGPPLRCRCQFKCSSANVLEHHRERGWEDSSGIHSIFRCCYCKGSDADAGFQREGYLAKHMKAKHDRNYKFVLRKKHECYFCQFETNQAATAIVHRRTCVRQFQLRNNLEPTPEDRDIPLLEVLKKTNAFSTTPRVVKILPKPKQVVTITKQTAQNPSHLQLGGAYAGEKGLTGQIFCNGSIRPPNQRSLTDYNLLPGPATFVSRASLSQCLRLKAPIVITPAPMKSQESAAAPILSTMQVCPICNGIVKDATVMAMHMQVCHPNISVSAYGPIPTVVSESDTGTCYLCRPPRTFVNLSFLQQHIACHHNIQKKPSSQAVQSASLARTVDVSQLRTRCRMCYALIVGNPVDHLSSMHMITLWMMLKRRFCYLCPEQFDDVANFESHMVSGHVALFPTQEKLWMRIEPTIPTAEIRRTGLNTTQRKFGEIKCPRCDSRHLSRISLYRHFYLVHGFGIVNQSCSICKVFVEDELSHMLEVHVRACTVVAIRLNDNVFQKYYARYLNSQKLIIHDDDLLNMHSSKPPLGTVKRYPIMAKPSLGTVKPLLGTVVVQPYRQISTVIRAPVRVIQPTAYAAVTVTQPRRSVVTLPKSVPRLQMNPPRVQPKVYDDTIIILDDDDDDIPIEKAAAPRNISASKQLTHESVVLTSDDSDEGESDEDKSNSDDDVDDSSNKDEVQDVWDDGELVYNVNDGDDANHHHVIDLNASHTSSKSSICESEDMSSEGVEELLSEDIEVLNLVTNEDTNDSKDNPNMNEDTNDSKDNPNMNEDANDSKDNPNMNEDTNDSKHNPNMNEDTNNSEDKESVTGTCPDGVYPLHLSSMVPSPCSQSPSPSGEDGEDPSSPLADQNNPSSPAGSEPMDEEEDNSDVDMDNMVMEIDDETVVIVNEDSD